MRKVKAPIVGGISDFVGGADLPDLIQSGISPAKSCC